MELKNLPVYSVEDLPLNRKKDKVIFLEDLIKAME